MMKRIIVCLLFLFLVIQLVNAAEVCVVVDYGKETDKDPDSKCVDIDQGKNGFELMEETGWNLLWGPETAFGRMLCRINGVGTDVSGQYCEYSGKFWNFVLNINGEWLHMPVGLDAGDICWNYDINSWDGHYCAKDGDVLGFAFGEAGSKPEMFKVNVTRIYVDGDKVKDSDLKRGKIKDVLPGSKLEFKIELENLYDGNTEIDIKDVSITGTIEEIDDGNDIEEEIDEFDLEADKKKTEELGFTIPLEVESKDRLLVIEIEAKDDTGIKYEKEFKYDVEIEKEDHKLEIIKAEPNKDSYACGKNALLDLLILNTGQKDENVNLQITNQDLGIGLSKKFEIENGAFEASNKFGEIFNIWLPNNIDEKTYPITITADYGNEKEIKTTNLIISECEKTIEETVIPKIEKPSEEEPTEEEANKGREETITTIKEIIGKSNLPLILTAFLAVLVIAIVILLIILWLTRK